ncbi:MAG: ATP-binding cassette domain-containing protein [Ilumatobacteraceae bacterium]
MSSVPPVRPPAPPIVEVHDVTKRYGREVGVANVSFDVREGEVLGLLGPNGSGKTTLLRLMLGLLHITSGRIAIFGRDVGDAGPRLRARIGYLPGDLALYDQQTVRQYLRFVAALRRMDLRESIEALAGRFDLDLDRRIGDLSRGTRQKVAVVQAFMHGPALLLLDEPTSGLDPIVQREFEALVDETRLRGATILLSSHILAEVERLADRVAVMREGCLAVVDDVAMLKSRFTRTIDLEFPAAVDPEPFRAIPGVSDVHVARRTLSCSVVGPETALLREAVARGVVGVHAHDPSLDDIFMRIIDGPRA